MEIKPTGPGANVRSVPDNNQPVGKAFSQFAEPAQAAAAVALENLPLSSVLTNFKKADLQDPAKVEQMLSQCAQGLLGDTLTNSSVKLSPAQSSYVAGLLQNDPSVRGKLLNYLERALT